MNVKALPALLLSLLAVSAFADEATLTRFIATAPKERYGDDLATARQALASLQ